MNNNQVNTETPVGQMDAVNASLNALTLAHPLVQDYNNSHNIGDLYLAIDHYINHGSIDDSDRLETLRWLTGELMKRADEFSDVQILDIGIKLIYDCIELEKATENDRRTWINNIITLEMKKYIGDDSSPSNDLLFDRWYYISESLKLRSQAINNASVYYLDAAIQSLRTTVTFAKEGTLSFVKAKHMLGACLLDRFNRTGNHNDLNEGNKCSRTLGKPSEYVQITAERFRQLFIEESNESQLMEKMKTYRESLKEISNAPDVHMKLGMTLSSLFKISGDITRLNEAIMHLRKAVKLAPNDGIAYWALALASIQKVKITEYETPEKFEEIKNLINKAISLLPFNIGSISETIFGMLDPNSLQVTVSRMQGMVPIAMNQFDKAIQLAQWMRGFYSVTSDIKFLDTSISHAREAIELCPDVYSMKYMLHYNLAEAQYTRYTYTKQTDDLEDSINSYEKCVGELPPSNYFTAEFLLKLAIAKESKFLLQVQNGLSPSQNEPIVRAMLGLLKTAGWDATSSPTVYRIGAAMMCAMYVETFDRERALKAYDKVLDLLPRLSLLGTSLEEQYQDISKKIKTDGFSRKAALNAIALGKYEKAIDYKLEAGRAVFWQKALNLGISTDHLHEANPTLEERFSKICAELSRYSGIKNPGGRAPDTVKEDEVLVQLGILNKDLEDVLVEIHNLEGFRDFLLPKKLNDIQKLLKYPVVYLIPTDTESHALIVLPNDVKHVLLPDASYKELLRIIKLLPRISPNTKHLSAVLQQSVAWDNLPMNNTRHGGPALRLKASLTEVLRFLWKNIVSHIVTALELTKESHHKTRLFWCPIGIFSFLPLHAAGIYKDDMSSVVSTFDYFISSYTPTAAAITTASDVKSHAPSKMMVVIDPTGLPYAVDEMHKIEKRIPSDILLRFGTAESPALVETVASKMSETSVVHFACHGTQVMDNPLQSYLKLLDGGLTISRIMEQNMPNATLAFLCACESAMGD